jgi:hypothetical protein
MSICSFTAACQRASSRSGAARAASWLTRPLLLDGHGLSGIYRRPTGVLEVGIKGEIGRQRWRTVDGGILVARKSRDDLIALRGRGEGVATNPKRRSARRSASAELGRQRLDRGSREPGGARRTTSPTVRRYERRRCRAGFRNRRSAAHGAWRRSLGRDRARVRASPRFRAGRPAPPRRGRSAGHRAGGGMGREPALGWRYAVATGRGCDARGR